VGSNISASKGEPTLSAKRLALGTVQFGLPYGIANQIGQVSLAEARKILTQAFKEGLNTLDTAIAYGESETRLGAIGVSEWRVVSKLQAAPEHTENIEKWVRGCVAGLLTRLMIPRLYGLLLHRPNNLLGPYGRELYAALRKVKDDGLVHKIGVSVYCPEELDIFHHKFPIDLVQAPFNVFDRRIATSGQLNRLKQSDIEVHTRSAFLQGLLLMAPDRRPAKFNRWRFLWNTWDQWLVEGNMSPVQACLGFPLRYPEVDRVVVGVDSEAQLSELLTAAIPGGEEPPESLITQDNDLINPSRWSSH
jgi:aryl-alcohol dehydrogenase-like predicted oxidoreductase